MNILSLLTDTELKTLTQMAAMYGVNSDQYMNYFNEMADKYHNVTLVHFKRLRLAQEPKKKDSDNKDV